MYADFMAYLDLLLVIIVGVTLEERVICFVEYYFIVFYEGRKGVLVKKFYNFIIGEIFYCFWEVFKDRVKLKRIVFYFFVSYEYSMIDDFFKSYKLRFVVE